MSEDLIAFLAARLDEDEAVAQEVASAVGYRSRALREAGAKRAILGRHMPHQPAFGGLACNWCSDDVDDRPQIAKERWPCPDVRSVAAVYSGHPDYDEAWRP